MARSRAGDLKLRLAPCLRRRWCSGSGAHAAARSSVARSRPRPWQAYRLLAGHMSSSERLGSRRGGRAENRRGKLGRGRSSGTGPASNAGAALLSSAPRSASVRAARTSELIAIAREDFERLLCERPQVSLGLTRAMAEQLRASRASLTSARPFPVVIAVVALDESVPIAQIVPTLAAAMGRYATVAVLDGSEVSPPPPREAAVAAYAPLLDRGAAVSDHVLLIAHPPGKDEAWTDFCLQHPGRR